MFALLDVCIVTLFSLCLGKIIKWSRADKFCQGLRVGPWMVLVFYDIVYVQQENKMALLWMPG